MIKCNNGLLVILFIFNSRISTFGKLTVIPQNVAILTGSRVELTCASDSASSSKPVTWNVIFLNSSQATLLSTAGNLASAGLASIYEVVTGSINGTTARFNLVIKSADQYSAGTYLCSDTSETAGRPARAEVIVLDSPARCLPSVNTNPVCENNQINLTCSVTFHGRYPPVISFLPSWMGVVFNKSEGNEAKYINSFYASRLLNDLSIQSVTNFSQPTSPNVPNYTLLQSFPSIFQYGPTSCSAVMNGSVCTCTADSFPKSTFTWYDEHELPIGAGSSLMYDNSSDENVPYSCVAVSNCGRALCYTQSTPTGPSGSSESIESTKLPPSILNLNQPNKDSSTKSTVISSSTASEIKVPINLFHLFFISYWLIG